jgi:hypothetical protein
LLLHMYGSMECMHTYMYVIPPLWTIKF